MIEDYKSPKSGGKNRGKNQCSEQNTGITDLVATGEDLMGDLVFVAFLDPALGEVFKVNLNI
jgi:hypothetical protein